MIWPKRYVCPLLVLAQYGLMKMLPGRPVQIAADGCLVRIMPAGHGVEAELWWPRSWVMAECRFWNSRVGFMTRAAADVVKAVWRTEHERS